MGQLCNGDRHDYGRASRIDEGRPRAFRDPPLSGDLVAVHSRSDHDIERLDPPSSASRAAMARLAGRLPLGPTPKGPKANAWALITYKHRLPSSSVRAARPGEVPPRHGFDPHEDNVQALLGRRRGRGLTANLTRRGPTCSRAAGPRLALEDPRPGNRGRSDERSAYGLMACSIFATRSGGGLAIPWDDLAWVAAIAITSAWSFAPFTSKPHAMPKSAHLKLVIGRLIDFTRFRY